MGGLRRALPYPLLRRWRLVGWLSFMRRGVHFGLLVEAGRWEKRGMKFFAILGMGVLFCGALAAQGPPEAGQEKVRVGVFVQPPFAMKDESGEWTGIAVDLWEKVNEELRLPFEYVEVPVEKILPSLARGELDIGLGELMVTANWEQQVEFTQPYLFSTAGVALRKDATTPKLAQFLSEVARHGVTKVIIAMGVTLLVFSILFWIVERRVEQGHFSGRPAHGLGSALWFAAVTMTTVGYGDKTPHTPAGRFLAFLWMFFGILMVSAFTGTVASAITVTRLNAGVQNFTDLAHYRTGVLAGSPGQNILSNIGIPAQKFPTVEDGLNALQEKKISAFVSSEVTLRYLTTQEYPEDFQVTPLASIHMAYAMAARANFPKFKALNVAVTRETTKVGWQDEINRWLGPPAGQ